VFQALPLFSRLRDLTVLPRFLVYHAKRSGVAASWSDIMRVKSEALLILLACLILAVACGQKGPLYLPGRTSTFESMTPQQQPDQNGEPAEEESEEDNEEQSDNIN
jgi:predicted small lipoprotein YifL